MSIPVARLSDSLRTSHRAAWLVVLVTLGGISAIVGIATWQEMLPALLGLAVVGLVTLVGFRWPLLPLLLFGALIPIEEVALIGGFGTVSRLTGIIFAVTYGVPRLGRMTFGSMPPAAWAYVAWAMLSLGWAIAPEEALAQLPTLLQLFLVALLVGDFVVQRPEIVRPILWIYSLAATATALVGIWLYVGEGFASNARATIIQDQDPAQFAAVLLPALVFGLYQVLHGDRRVLGGAVALATATGVVVSGTRGAWVAVVVVVLLVILPQLRPRRRIAAMAVLVALAAMVYQLPGVPDLLTERVGSALSSGGAGRTDIWSVAVTIYRSAPALGVGYANFPIAYTPEAVRASGVSAYLLTERAPHNVVLGTLVELGPIGPLLLALFLGPLVLQRGWGPDAATVQAALVSLLTLALFLDVLANRKQVWLMIGLAAGLAYFARQRQGMLAQDGKSSGLAEKPVANVVDVSRAERR